MTVTCKHLTDFGSFGICCSDNALIKIEFSYHGKDTGHKSALHDETAKQIDEYLHGQRKAFDVPIKPEGTDFMLKVWAALQQIPYGQTASYKDIAIAIGNSKAYRAVGMANNKNPLPLVIPCHRVIGSNKKLVGYAGGLDLKEKLLRLEGGW